MNAEFEKALQKFHHDSANQNISTNILLKRFWQAAQAAQRKKIAHEIRKAIEGDQP